MGVFSLCSATFIDQISLNLAIQTVISLRPAPAGRKCLPILSVYAFDCDRECIHSQRRRLEPNDTKAH